MRWDERGRHWGFEVPHVLQVLRCQILRRAIDGGRTGGIGMRAWMVAPYLVNEIRGEVTVLLASGYKGLEQAFGRGHVQLEVRQSLEHAHILDRAVLGPHTIQ